LKLTCMTTTLCGTSESRQASRQFLAGYAGTVCRPGVPVAGEVRPSPAGSRDAASCSARDCWLAGVRMPDAGLSPCTRPQRAGSAPFASLVRAAPVVGGFLPRALRITVAALLAAGGAEGDRHGVPPRGALLRLPVVHLIYLLN